jgi:hypothetical protein
MVASINGNWPARSSRGLFSFSPPLKSASFQQIFNKHFSRAGFVKNRYLAYS